jgi:anti-sigma regulatory factor (Ser/Thr protein kinase)
MHRWGEADRADDVASVVSELLANALRHALPEAGEDMAPWPIRLGLLHAGPYVVCAVADPGAGIPVLREPGQLEESGRGLLVVASLSDQWGYCPAPDRPMRGGEQGKVVWAAFAAASLF